MKKNVPLAIICFLLVISMAGHSRQAGISKNPEAKIPFDFDHEVARKLALVALEEFDHYNPAENRKLSDRFNVDNPGFSGKYLVDCKKGKVKAVLVVFESKDHKGSACVKLSLGKDDYFIGVLERGYRSENRTTEISNFENPKYLEMDCGD